MSVTVDLPDERPEVLRAIRALVRRGDHLTADIVRQMEAARREMLGRLLGGEETELSIIHLSAIVAQVNDRITSLFQGLAQTHRSAIFAAAAHESEVALEEAWRLPWDATERHAIRILSPRISHEMVRHVADIGDGYLRATSSQVQEAIRGQLTRSMMMGESTHKAAKRILGEGLTNDGIRPAFKSAEERAVVIARTELANAANAAHVETYEQLGAAPELSALRVRWSSAMCPGRTCHACRSLHGQTKAPGEMFEVRLSKNRVWRGKGPTVHPRCLCRVVADLSDLRERLQTQGRRVPPRTAAVAAPGPAAPAAQVETPKEPARAPQERAFRSKVVNAADKEREPVQRLALLAHTLGEDDKLTRGALEDMADGMGQLQRRYKRYSSDHDGDDLLAWMMNGTDQDGHAAKAARARKEGAAPPAPFKDPESAPSHEVALAEYVVKTKAAPHDFTAGSVEDQLRTLFGGTRGYGAAKLQAELTAEAKGLTR